MEKSYPEAIVVRVPGKKLFSGGAARNAGAIIVPLGEWVCFIDADVIVPEGFCSDMLDRCKPGHVLQVARERSLSGTCVVNRDDWARSGGYEEWCSWGYEDLAFYESLELAGVKAIDLKIKEVEHLHHSNRRRSCFGETNDIESSNDIHRKYAMSRNEMIRRVGRPLTPDERSRIENKHKPMSPALEAKE